MLPIHGPNDELILTKLGIKMACILQTDIGPLLSQEYRGFLRSSLIGLHMNSIRKCRLEAEEDIYRETDKKAK
ncbi:jg4736 [Pararge aegeria aegeria]|uniref:Jg4736 protein n=1 Tax=Pararge aegeria aegeria TaxID=348720 RepID=A0A8S4QL48_9NEOP|nr:jg4736 [Pararge aegeria aegeria]